MLLFIDTPTVTDKGQTGGVCVFTLKSEECLEERGDEGDLMYNMGSPTLCFVVYMPPTHIFLPEQDTHTTKFTITTVSQTTI